MKRLRRFFYLDIFHILVILKGYIRLLPGIRVYSDTWLDDLKISDQCVCDNAVPPPKPATPLELVFVLDGSDSYNTEVS